MFNIKAMLNFKYHRLSFVLISSLLLINFVFAVAKPVVLKDVKFVKPVIGNEDVSGDNQVQEVLQLLKKPLVIQLVNSKGIPLSNQNITFAVLAEPKENIFKTYKNMSSGFKHYFHTTGIFSLAYFSFGFLLLKAYLVGFAIKDVVLLYALFNIAFVIVAAPLGKLGDYIGRRKIIALEYIIYFIMSVGFIFSTTKIHVIVLFCLFGIFYAIDEGQSKAYISDLESKKRATAIGIYNFMTAIIYLPASVIAGALWKINPNYAFMFAALVSVTALIVFLSKKQ